MKLCAVYKASRRADTYLYVPEKGDFTKVPSALLKAVGTPLFVMLIPVGKREHIANLPRDTFIEKVQAEGFYLQLPPKVESLLESHRQDLGHDPKP
ncbi:YcgL domain-containing protein [Glaciecola sp. SC05]|uniref:YcgL domain-containing protein n=1 Tax=Glaciecola sp. SC05 TaxID=1987355 RepID=UPI003527E11A